MLAKHDHVNNLVRQLYYWHLRIFKNHLHNLWLRKNIQINTHAFQSAFVFCCQTVNSEPPSWIRFLQLRHCSILDSCLWGQSKISLAYRLEMKLRKRISWKDFVGKRLAFLVLRSVMFRFEGMHCGLCSNRPLPRLFVLWLATKCQKQRSWESGKRSRFCWRSWRSVRMKETAYPQNEDRLIPFDSSEQMTWIL